MDMNLSVTPDPNTINVPPHYPYITYAEMIGDPYFSPVAPDIFKNEDLSKSTRLYVQDVSTRSDLTFRTLPEFVNIYWRSYEAKEGDPLWSARRFWVEKIIDDIASHYK